MGTLSGNITTLDQNIVDKLKLISDVLYSIYTKLP